MSSNDSSNRPRDTQAFARHSSLNPTWDGESNSPGFSLNFSDRLTVSDMAQRCRGSKIETLAKIYPHPFLICRIDHKPIEGSDAFTIDTRTAISMQPLTELKHCPVFFIVKGALRNSEDEQFDKIFIGRSQDNDVVLDYPSVSKNHACLQKHNNSWWVTDLGSYNGTYLNGQRLEPKKAEKLTAGVCVDFSKRLSFLFLDNQTMFQHLEELSQDSE